MKTATRNDRSRSRRKASARTAVKQGDEFNKATSVEFEREGMGVAPKE